MQVVDPHMHFWDLKTHHYPWLANPGTSFVGDAKLLRHDYLPSDLSRDAGPIEVIKVVHVEANHDPLDPVEETRWLQSLADDTDEADSANAEQGVSGTRRALPNAIVAAADLSAPNAEATLAAHAAFPNTRGIRQILNVHADPLYRYVDRHFMRDAGMARELCDCSSASAFRSICNSIRRKCRKRRNLRELHPQTQFVLNHTGMFVDRDSPAGYRAWRDGLRTLSLCPNVAVKISGLAMFDHRWTVESLRPYVLETIDTFGIERAMFASNFPVDRLFGRYEALWQAYACDRRRRER